MTYSVEKLAVIFIRFAAEFSLSVSFTIAREIFGAARPALAVKQALVLLPVLLEQAISPFA